MEAVIFDLDGLISRYEIISLKFIKNSLEIFRNSFHQKKPYSRDHSGHRERRMFNDFLDTYDLPWNSLTKPWQSLWILEARILAQVYVI